MNWFPDMAWLWGEWWLVWLLGALLGLLVGWAIWSTKANRIKAEAAEENEELRVKWLAAKAQVVEVRADCKVHETELADLQAQVDAHTSVVKGLEDDVARVKTQTADNNATSRQAAEAEASRQTAADLAAAEAAQQALAAKQAEAAAEAPAAQSSAASGIDDDTTSLKSDDDDAFATRMREVSAGRQFDYTDNLKEISGVGPVMEKVLNDNGLFTFYQVALLTTEAVDALEGRVGAFPGRIHRDDWVPQAGELHLKHHREDIQDQVVIARWSEGT